MLDDLTAPLTHEPSRDDQAVAALAQATRLNATLSQQIPPALQKDICNLFGPAGPGYRPLFRCSSLEVTNMTIFFDPDTDEAFNAALTHLAHLLTQNTRVAQASGRNVWRAPSAGPAQQREYRVNAIRHFDTARALLSCLHRLTEFAFWCTRVAGLSPVFDPLTKDHEQHLNRAALDFLAGVSSQEFSATIRQLSPDSPNVERKAVNAAARRSYVNPTKTRHTDGMNDE